MTLKERSEGGSLRRRFVVLVPTLLLLHLQKSLEVSSRREMRLKGAQPDGPKGLTWTEGLHFRHVVSRWCCAVPCQGLVLRQVTCEDAYDRSQCYMQPYLEHALCLLKIRLASPGLW